MLRRLAMPLLTLLLTVCFFWKLTLSGQYSWMDQPDNAGQVMPMLQEETVQWHQGKFPLWDPHLWGGQPIPGQVQPGALNPLNWILFSMPLDAKGEISCVTLNWFYALIHWLALMLAYWLARDAGLSRLAALLCGCAYALGGFVANVGWLQHEMSGLLLPVVLLYLLRLLRGHRPLASAALSGAFLGASFLMGHHNVPVFATVAVLGFWIYYYIALEKTRTFRAGLPAAAFFLCYALIAATQVLPSYELGVRSLRSRSPGTPRFPTPSTAIWPFSRSACSASSFPVIRATLCPLTSGWWSCSWPCWEPWRSGSGARFACSCCWLFWRFFTPWVR
jgi:hypothetical protein